jgi:hypothetical protein
MSTLLEPAVAGRVTADALPQVKSAALWALVGAKLVGGLGLGWDIRWHLLIGRDSFWIPPHLMTYAAVAFGAVVSLGILALETRRARGGRSSPDAVRVVGLVGSPGFQLAWWGMVIIIVAAPIDDFWHRLFGLDVTLWSPPHLLGMAGAQVNTLGCMLIALEVYAPGSRGRLGMLLVTGTLLFGLFQILADPSIRTAFLHGGIAFFSYAFLGALTFTFALALTARLAVSRSAPLVLALGAVIFQLGVIVVSTVGFAILQPVSVIQEAIASDPTSPIAVAHEISRRNGTTPGRSMTLRLLPLLPAALMVWAGATRGWRLASLASGAGLLAVSGAVLARSPALSHARPGPVDVVLAVPLVLAAALVGGWCAAALARRFLRSPATR